jgi:transcriptional regulator with XRE-family HTH domain
VVVTSTAYRALLARNVRATRAAREIGQQELAARMRALGFTAWLHQTVHAVERGKRRLVAEELLALALALETTVNNLQLPDPDDEPVALPSGDEMAAASVVRVILSGGMSHGIRPVTWEDDKPVFHPELRTRGHVYEDMLRARVREDRS